MTMLSFLIGEAIALGLMLAFYLGLLIAKELKQ